MEKKMETTLMKNEMEKNIENQLVEYRYVKFKGMEKKMEATLYCRVEV